MAELMSHPESPPIDGQEYIVKSFENREKGRFFESVEDGTRALHVFIRDNNHPKVSESFSGLGLTYRHLFEREGNIDFGIASKNYHQAALEVLRKNNIPQQYKALYELGKIYQTLGEDDNAINNIEQAINNFHQNPGQYPYPESVVAEMETRLFALKFKKGESDAFDKYTASLEKLKSAENPDEYTKKVWLSGGYMHMVEVLIGKDSQKARELLENARIVIGTDEQYSLRRSQILKLEERI